MNDALCHPADNMETNSKQPATTAEAKAASSFTASDGSALLLPCPFCGGDAESDTMQGFRRMKDGRPSNAVAIYCSKCTAQVSMCHEDHKEYTPDDLLTILTEAWNLRVPNADVSDPRRS